MPFPSTAFSSFPSARRARFLRYVVHHLSYAFVVTALNLVLRTGDLDDYQPAVLVKNVDGRDAIDLESRLYNLRIRD